MADLIKKALVSPAGDDPLEYVMSDESVDRVGDVIEAKAWNISNFVKNPVALFIHDHRFVVGHWSNVRVQSGKLIGRLNLLPKGISERLNEIRAAVEMGVLRAVSVGFAADPVKTERRKEGGLLFRAVELMECSLVPVPANPNALQIAKSLNFSDDVKSLIFSESDSLPEIPAPPAPAASGKSVRVVRLDEPARVRVDPFIIRQIVRT